MSEPRIRLKVLGLSVGAIRQGAYALILAQVDGPIRIPVVIGTAEADAISVRMEHIIPPRPLVYDLFATMTHAFGIALQEVFICKFENGVFHSELIFTDGERRVSVDSRTSDAIAIAMRTNSPIYTTPEILQECGFVIEGEEGILSRDDDDDSQPDETEMTVEELESLLNEAVASENYEEAARLNALISEKKNCNNTNE